MSRSKLKSAALACVGLEVSLQSPFYAILSQGADLVLADICELVDMYAIPVVIREDSPWVEFIRVYESYHHILTSRDSHRLYCAYLSLPRLLLAMRNNKLFARFVVNSPLDISGDVL